MYLGVGASDCLRGMPESSMEKMVLKVRLEGWVYEADKWGENFLVEKAACANERRFEKA